MHLPSHRITPVCATLRAARIALDTHISTVAYSFAYRRYSLPFRTPVRTAHGVWARREGLLVRLETESGEIGFGECAPVPWFGTESVDEAVAACAALGGRVSDGQIEGIGEKYPCLRFALGREHACVPEHAHDSLPVAALLPAGRAALEKIGARAESGFRTFKWKVGVGDVGDEMALLDDVLGAMPAGARLRLDANGAWSRRVAERWLARCAGYPGVVEFVEQPVAHDARGGEDLLSGLARDYPTAIALDESVAGVAAIHHWLQIGWPGVFVIKPSLLGDAGDVLSMLPPGRTVFSSAMETAVGARAALGVAFRFYALSATPLALGFGVWPLFSDARFDGPHAAPFIRRADLDAIKPEVLWNALN